MKFKDRDTGETFTVDWSTVLGEDVMIVPNSFECFLADDTPDDIELGTKSFNETQTSVRIDGGQGTEGAIYEVIHQVDASDGRTALQITQRIKIRER